MYNFYLHTYVIAITDWIAICLACLNIILICFIFYREGKRATKIEKHHDTISWYQAFGFHSRVEELFEEIKILKEKVVNAINTNKPVDEVKKYYQTFSDKIKSFKSDFLDVVEFVDSTKVSVLTDKLDALKDKAAFIVQIMALDEDKLGKLEKLMSDLRKIVIEVGVKTSLYK